MQNITSPVASAISEGNDVPPSDSEMLWDIKLMESLCLSFCEFSHSPQWRLHLPQSLVTVKFLFRRKSSDAGALVRTANAAEAMVMLAC